MIVKRIFKQVSEIYAKGGVTYQQCSACGHMQQFARNFCVACLRPDPEWRDATEGTVVAVTTMHRAPTPEWKARLPYAIALMDLTGGPRIMALADQSLRPGDHAVLRVGGLHNLPFFELNESEAST